MAEESERQESFGERGAEKELSFRQRLISVCRGKLWSFADLPGVFRSVAQILNDNVKYKRVNLSDRSVLIPFIRNESFRARLAMFAGRSRASMYDKLESGDWQRNPRYRKTSFLENLAKIAEENLDKEPEELCRMLFDCEDRFRAEDEACGDGAAVDYRGFLEEIGFFGLLREAITVRFLEDEPTVVLALVSLFGRRVLDVIGLVK